MKESNTVSLDKLLEAPGPSRLLCVLQDYFNGHVDKEAAAELTRSFDPDELVDMRKALEATPALDRHLARSERLVMQAAGVVEETQRDLERLIRERNAALRDAERNRQRIQNFRNKAKGLEAQVGELRRTVGALKSGRSSTGTDPSEVATLRSENIRLQEELESVRSQLEDLAFRHAQTKARLEDLQAELEGQKALPESDAAPGQEQACGIEIPVALTGSTCPPLSEIANWAHQFKDRLVLLPRAAKAAAAGRYRDPALSFRGLELLATAYWPMRMGELSRKDYEDRLKALRLEDSQTTNARYLRSGEISSHWFYFEGERIFMDRHLKRGGGADERTCFRLYFTWHEERKLIIVGHLPSHLPSYVDV